MKAYTTDLSGRQLDIELLQTIAAPAGSTRLSISVTDQPKSVAGIQKMAQRYTLLLLTELGDVHFDAEAGSSFWEDMIAGAAQNAGQVAFAFAFASSDAIEQMQREDNNSALYGEIPEDERIVSADLDEWSINYQSATLFLKVSLYNRLGDAYVYVLPAKVARS